MQANLVQINVSNGGMPKTALAEGARVTKDGVEGDWQNDRRYHGGPDRAICIFSEELYAWLREQGIDLANGSVGENFTTRGIDLDSLAAGDCLRVGDCLVEITNVRIPCRNLNQWDPLLLKTIQGRSGWVAKVVEEGFVRAGDDIQVMRKGT